MFNSVTKESFKAFYWNQMLSIISNLFKESENDLTCRLVRKINLPDVLHLVVM